MTTPVVTRPMMIRTATALALLLSPLPALAQDGSEDTRPRRTRVIVGPALVPNFPGSDEVALRPYFDLARARGDDIFLYSAPDESSSIAIVNRNGLTFGPALSFEGRRRSQDVGGLDRVGFTVEVGAAAQYQTDGPLRFLIEARKGIGGHKGVIGMAGVDYVARDGDRWLFAVGPRLTVGDSRYARAYFGVTPRETLATGIATYDPGTFWMAGGTASALRQLSDRWGVFGYAKYDRILGDAADSPVTQRFGSRNQLSGGLGVSYTFGRR